jgi:hypothetical protein
LLKVTLFLMFVLKDFKKAKKNDFILIRLNHGMMKQIWKNLKKMFVQLN